VANRTSLRLDMTAEYSESVDALERVVRFARELEELGLEVRITGDVGVVVETVRSEQVGMHELLEARAR
jgi:hypothetical protein